MDALILPVAIVGGVAIGLLAARLSLAVVIELIGARASPAE